MLHPLVFIHGIKGSALSRHRGERIWLTAWEALGLASPDLSLPIQWDDDGQQRDDLEPISPLRTVAGQDVYSSFLKWGETSRRPFYPFAYDWRRDNLETTDTFLKFLDTVNNRHGAKVQVVAHSMGGLISFATLNRRPDLFHSILFAGVPFGHALGFLEDMHAGTSTGMNKRILSARVLFTCASPYCFFPSNTFKSGLTEQGGGPIHHDWYSPDDWERNKLGIFGTPPPEEITDVMRSHLRNALAHARAFRSMLVCQNEPSFRYPPVAVLASDARPTLSTVVRNGPRAVKGWDFRTGSREPGDGRVLLSNAVPPSGVPYTVYKSRHEHGALLRDTSQVSKILTELNESQRRLM